VDHEGEDEMSETEIGLATLSADECRALLVTHRPQLGRLAFIAGDWPLVLPMNFAVDGNVVYFRSAAGSKLDAAVRCDRVAFQVDHVDEVWEEGWSLLACGHLRVVDDPDELAQVRRLPLRPWAGGDRPYFLRLQIVSLSGRRIAFPT
jgi:nitroimidazol reductase NimA-like FMN-containing flavoprotein (pyridoxamine 5'-phosphate oxidase superfamily)